MVTIPGFDEKSGLLSNILAIGGFVILIIIVVWGFIHLARLSGSWVSSLAGQALFGGKNPEVTLTVPAEATSGVAFPLSWKYASDEEGSYVFLYQCANGVRFETPGIGGASTAIPCGAAFPIGSAEGSLSLLPLSGEAAIVPLSVVFMPTATGSAQAQGSASVRVAPAVAAGDVNAPTLPSSQSAAPSAPTSAPIPADLSVRITSVSQDAGVTVVAFDIANTGGSPTGTWYFTAQLPTSQPYTYTSSAQASLAPGDHIANTLRFTGVMSGGLTGQGGNVGISVDPSNAVAESNESNNYASQWVNAPYQSGYYTAPAAPAYNYYTPNQYQYYGPQYSYPYQYYSNQTPYQYLGSYQYPYGYQY